MMITMKLALLILYLAGLTMLLIAVTCPPDWGLKKYWLACARAFAVICVSVFSTVYISEYL